MALCARCNGEHATKECSLPFLRTKTRQEERDAEHAAFLVRQARRKEKAERAEAQHAAPLARQERRNDERDAFLAREKRRNEKADRKDKEVESLLANESKLRLRIVKEAEQRDITRAEVDRKDKEAQRLFANESKLRLRILEESLEEAEQRDITPAEVLGEKTIDGDGIEWWLDNQSGWWWWRAAEGRWQSTGRRYKPKAAPSQPKAPAPFPPKAAAPSQPKAAAPSQPKAAPSLPKVPSSQPLPAPLPAPSVAASSTASDAGSDNWRRPMAAPDDDVASDSGLSTAASLSAHPAAPTPVKTSTPDEVVDADELAIMTWLEEHHQLKPYGKALVAEGYDLALLQNLREGEVDEMLDAAGVLKLGHRAKFRHALEAIKG